MITEPAAPADFTGARGSNAGDQFHELWALQQILRLLKPNNDGFEALTVEGIGDAPPIDPSETFHRWEGVDCALYFGGSALTTAARIELAQLKYSAANPGGKWTIARLCESTKKDGNNSVMRRLADDFTKARKLAKPDAIISSRLVSNQEVGDDVKNGLRYDVAPKDWDPKDFERHKANREQLRTASGLGKKAFAAFVAALDISGCGSQSRHSVGLDVVAALARVLGDDVLSELSQLRARVRDLMLPEGVRTVTNRDRLLSWFGVYDWNGLFPAPPKLDLPVDPIHRSAADEVARHFESGEKLVLLHGEGGSGKTTLTQQVLSALPDGSVQVTFDCFGGGAYMYATDRRHLAEKAYLQLINDIAVACDCPLFIPRSGTHPTTIETFMRRLALASATLAQVRPEALLLIVVDAADNAVTAATAAWPPERPFVWDLAEIDKRTVPANVRLLVSTRTGRKDSLHFSGATKEVVCDTFSLPESAVHLRRKLPKASDGEAARFHELTGANPRVQAYVLSVAGETLQGLFISLLPNGRTLPEVLEKLFQDALEKLGIPHTFEKIVATLAVLPPPASIRSIAAVAECDEATVRDFALDLRKGLRISDGALTVADEDFEKFIADRSGAAQAAAIDRAAQHFWKSNLTDAYAAMHVVGFLLRANRLSDVVQILDSDPTVAGVSDPVTKREVLNSRLSLALAACRQSGNLVDELKTILLGAMARHDEGAFYDVIEKEMDLAAEFSHPTIYRRILIDRDRAADQGSALTQSAVAAARKGDSTGAMQLLARYEDWMRTRRAAPTSRRSDPWPITDRDVAAQIETIFRIGGVGPAIAQLNRWRPAHLRLRVAQIVVPRLIIQGFGNQLLEAIISGLLPGPFALTVAVSLQQAGFSVPVPVWKGLLERLHSLHIPRPDIQGNETQRVAMTNWADTLLNACEIAFLLKLPKAILRPVLVRLELVTVKNARLSIELRKAAHTDGVTRIWLLRQMIDRKDGAVDSFLAYVEAANAKSEAKRLLSKRRRVSSLDSSEVTRERSKLRTVHAVYAARLALIAAQRSGDTAATRQLAIPATTYDFDSGYESIAMRHSMALSVANLVFLPNISLVDLYRRAAALLERRYQPDDDPAPDLAVLQPFSLHASFHTKVLKIVADAAKKVEASLSRATRKVSDLVDYARFVFSINPSDAQALFTNALNIAKDIDDEVVDQLAFVKAIAPIACPDAGQPDATNAHRLATFAAGASLRLSDSDIFDWSHVLRALTTLDARLALASICRWADEGTASLSTTLRGFISVALDRQVLSPQVALAVAQTGQELTLDLIRSIVTRVVAKAAPEDAAIYDEIARSLLLDHKQAARVELGSNFLELIDGRISTHFVDALRAAVAFAPKDIATAEPKQHRRMPIAKEEDGDSPATTPVQQRFDPNLTDLNAVIRAGRSAGEFVSGESVLQDLADNHVAPRDRLAFLDALVKLDPDAATPREAGGVILGLLETWDSPSVQGWASTILPGVISDNLEGLARWLPYRDDVFDRLLKRCSLTTAAEAEVLLAGIAKAGTLMDSRVLFRLADRVASRLSGDQARDVLTWYLKHLEDRLPPADRAALSPRDTARSLPSALGRYFFALFSDIDTRIRWKAGHAVRLLARVGEANVIQEIFANFKRLRDDAFRAPDGPFYWQAARLWTSLVAYRIAFESPVVLQPVVPVLTEAVLGEDFPHVAIQEAAKRSLLELHARGIADLDPSTLASVSKVNVPIKIKRPSKTYRPHRSFNRTQARQSRRFRFDEMDTLPYWYNSLLRVFPDLDQERLLEMAETWIMDRWGAAGDERWKRPTVRVGRLRDRDYSLTMHGHGSLPTIEEYGTYLEWHAMLCVAAELVRSQAVGPPEYGQSPFDEWLEQFLPTNAPIWLADLRGPKPLEPAFWSPDPKDDTWWLRTASMADTLQRAGLIRSDQWLVVGGRTVYESRSRFEEVSVQTSLVSRDTADALLRSFMSASERYDTYLPSETDEAISWPGFELIGWLRRPGRDTGIDEKDTRRYDVRGQELGPGSEAVTRFSLHPAFAVTAIEYARSYAAFRYEAWGDEAPVEDRRSRVIESASYGWRLLADRQILAELLRDTNMCLICKVLVERRTHPAYSGPYDEGAKKKDFWKVVTLTPDGKIRDGNRDIGTWKASRRRAVI